jgi:hypothetical protein
MKERGIHFFITTEVELDNAQIDAVINRHPIQLKFDWPDDSVRALQDRLAHRGIIVVNAPYNSYGSDVLREILAAAGFSKKEIEAEVDENPGFDAAEEVFGWFTQGVEV